MNKNTVLLGIIFLLFIFTVTVNAKEKIVWPYICYSPIYICQDNQLTEGSGFHILNLLWKKMPEYEHKLLQMPIKRVLESAQRGEHQLFYGLYKTSAREKFLHFSIPCRISTPTFLVVRKADLLKFSDGKQVSLKNLLENKTLLFLYFQSISFGKGIDELLERYKGGANILTEYNTADIVEKSLMLLLNNRIDYMLSLDGAGREAKKLGKADKIAYLSIIEQNHYEIGYVAAPKNEWGLVRINQINKILREVIPTETFFQYFAPLVDETMMPELRKQFNTHILAPSKIKPGE